jgi:hypothetical protein
MKKPVALSLVGASLVLGVVLPAPRDVTLFLGAAGLGLGIGYAFFLERTSKAKVAAFQHWDEVYKVSNLAAKEEAERKYKEMVQEVEENSARILAMERSTAEEVARLQAQLADAQAKVMAQAEILREVAVTILTDKKYLKPGGSDVPRPA